MRRLLCYGVVALAASAFLRADSYLLTHRPDGTVRPPAGLYGVRLDRSAGERTVGFQTAHKLFVSGPAGQTGSPGAVSNQWTYHHDAALSLLGMDRAHFARLSPAVSLAGVLAALKPSGAKGPPALSISLLDWVEAVLGAEYFLTSGRRLAMQPPDPSRGESHSGDPWGADDFLVWRGLGPPIPDLAAWGRWPFDTVPSGGYDVSSWRSPWLRQILRSDR
jgi:hypothetical protein